MGDPEKQAVSLTGWSERGKVVGLLGHGEVPSKTKIEHFWFSKKDLCVSTKYPNPCETTRAFLVSFSPDRDNQGPHGYASKILL